MIKREYFNYNNISRYTVLLIKLMSLKDCIIVPYVCIYLKVLLFAMFLLYIVSITVWVAAYGNM